MLRPKGDYLAQKLTAKREKQVDKIEVKETNW